jgi:acetyl esterase
MPLHQQVKAFLALVEQSGEPRLYELSPTGARAQADQMNELIGAGPEVAAVEDFAIPGAAGDIRCRRYEPESAQATIVWVHGGGWVICDLDSHDAMCRILANAAECTVIAVDYRRAPEHRFPAALDDAWAALQWAGEQWPSRPLEVGGDSAGGNLAAVCALRARDRGGPPLALQALVYPVTDHDMTTSSYVEHGGEETLLGKKEMVWFWDHYLPDVAARDDPEASPLRAPDLAGLPPAIVVSAEYDPLRDEGRAYVERLRAAGVEVTHHHYDDMIHAFFSFVNVFARGDEAVAQVGRDIRAAVAAPRDAELAR